MDGVIRMSRRGAFVLSLVSLLVAAGLLYLSYSSIAWGVRRDDFRSLWSGGLLGLVVGYWGLYALAGGIGTMIPAITGRELPEPERTGTARHAGNHRYSDSSSADTEVDDDWDD